MIQNILLPLLSFHFPAFFMELKRLKILEVEAKMEVEMASIVPNKENDRFHFHFPTTTSMLPKMP